MPAAGRTTGVKILRPARASKRGQGEQGEQDAGVIDAELPLAAERANDATYCASQRSSAELTCTRAGRRRCAQPDRRRSAPTRARRGCAPRAAMPAGWSVRVIRSTRFAFVFVAQMMPQSAPQPAAQIVAQIMAQMRHRRYCMARGRIGGTADARDHGARAATRCDGGACCVHWRL